MPAVVVVALVLSTEGQDRWRTASKALPFALVVGLAQALDSWRVVVALGPEFPSLLGPMAGFLVAFALLRLRWLLPTTVWRIAAVDDTTALPESEKEGPSRTAAFAPYLLVLVLLVLTGVEALPVGTWLESATVKIPNLFGTGITAQLQPLYSPGTIFILSTALGALWLGGGWRGLAAAARTAGGITLKTAVALLAAIITVRVFIHSGTNAADLSAMPLVLARALAEGLGSVWPAVAPCVGALGSFIAGSATFSNMLFALMQLEVATELGYAPTLILALQGIGAAAGYMVCIHNVVAACAVAEVLGQEGSVLRRTGLPMLFYLLVTGLLGTLA